MENQNQESELKAKLRILLGQATIDDLIPETTIDNCINALFELKLEMGLSLSAITDSWPRPKKRQRVLSLSVDHQNLFESVTDWSGFPISNNVIQYFHSLLDEFSSTVPIELKSVTQIQGMTRDYSEIRSLLLSDELIEKLLKPLNNGTGTVLVQEQLVTVFLNLLMEAEEKIMSCFSGNERFFRGLISLLGSIDSMVKLKASLVLSFFVNVNSDRKIIIDCGGFKQLLQFLGEADSLSVCLRVPTRVAYYLLRDVVRANSDEDLILTAVKVFLGYIKSRKFLLDMLAPLEFMSRSAVSKILFREGTVSLIISVLKERRGVHIAECGVSILESCCSANPDALTIVKKELDIQIVREIPECGVHKNARRKAESLMKKLLNDRAEG